MLCRAYVCAYKALARNEHWRVEINKKAIGLVLIAALLIGGIAVFMSSGKSSTKTTEVKTITPVAAPSSAPSNFTFGNTGNCRAFPKFISPLGMRAPALDSRQNDGSKGLQIRDYAHKDKVWQHPSWKISGYIGAFDRDHQGNVYVSPLPYVSLQINPPEKQNQFYQVDSQTGEMHVFMTLPSSGKPDRNNPFGVMGLYFDCDTQSLYISSIAGSTAMQEKGTIFQIDVKSKTIKAKFTDIDTIGLGVFNTTEGKRLYFGSARDSSLYSVALDQKGSFTGEKRYEFSLSQLEGGDTTMIKKIKFKKLKNSDDYTMTLQDMEFGYRLMAENRPFKNNYHFEFNKNENKWDFKGLSRY